MNELKVSVHTLFYYKIKLRVSAASCTFSSKIRYIRPRMLTLNTHNSLVDTSGFYGGLHYIYKTTSTIDAHIVHTTHDFCVSTHCPIFAFIVIYFNLRRWNLT